MKKISVIIPVYNIEQYIGECIESIIGQTYKNMQIILIDDGSTDASGKICDAYKEKDNRIIVIHQKNGGLSVARNTGISVADGELIGFVDGDDVIHPQMYERLWRSMLLNQADIVECCVSNICDTKDIDFSKVSQEDEIVISGEKALKWLLSIGRKERYPRYAVWSKLYKRELIKDELFPVGFVHEDYCYDTKVFLKANRYVILKERLYFYRKRLDSITGSGFSNKDLDKLVQIEESIRFLKKQGKEKFVELAKINYYMTEFLYYVKALENHNIPTAEKMQTNLLLNKKYILKMALPFRYKIENYIFYINPYFYYIVYVFKRKIKKLMRAQLILLKGEE